MTKDLADTLRQKIGLSLSEETAGRINGLEDAFLIEFWPCIPPGINWTSVRARTISTELERIARRTGSPVVSMDRVYLPRADAFFEATRVTDDDFNPDWDRVTIGNRYGTPPLIDQARALKRLGPIVLADVGAYTGDTILEVCEIIEGQGVTIQEVCLGISSIPALERMKGKVPVRACNTFSFYEWIELRDFFGIDGRAVPNPDGTREFIPYSERLGSWASIPTGTIPLVKQLCEGYNRRLIDLLATDTKTPVVDLERKIGKKGWCYIERFEMKTIDLSDFEDLDASTEDRSP